MLKNVIRLYSDILRVDTETRTVVGYAYVTADPGDGFVLPRAVMEAATADYLKFANVREMHRASAVGTCKVEWDDTGALMTAEIVDDAAWDKVQKGVYKGFSVGVKPRRVKRAAGNKTEVLEGTWFETSLVDRPADPESMFEIARAEGIDLEAEPEVDTEEVPAAPVPSPSGMFRGFLMAKLSANEPQTLIREALSCLDSFCWQMRYSENISSSIPEGMTMRSAFIEAMNDCRDYVAPLIDRLPLSRAEGEEAPVTIADALRAFGTTPEPDSAFIERLTVAEAGLATMTTERDQLLQRIAELDATPDPAQTKPFAKNITDEDIERMHKDLISRREAAANGTERGRIKLKSEYETEEEKNAAFLEVNRAK